MDIRRRCPSCGAKFSIPERYAGRKVKCPKCLSAVDIPPATGQAPPAAAASPPPTRKPEKPRSTAPRKPGAAPVRRKPPPAKPAAPAEPVGEGIVVATDKGVAGSLSGPARGRRKDRTGLFILGGVGVGLLLIVGVVVAFSLTRNSNSSTTAHNGADAPEKKNGAGRNAALRGDGRTVLVLDWRESDRAGATVFVDHAEKAVPTSGPVEYELAPGEHQLAILRRGYEQVEATLNIRDGETKEYEPRWNKIPDVAVTNPGNPSPRPGTDSSTGMSSWLQDWTVAKRKAAAENKDVLVAFNGSDWCPPCKQMISKVLSKDEFRRQVEGRFVLVFFDFPRGEEAKSRVQDPAGNKRLAEHFRITSFPTIVLADADARPYGFHRGYSGEDVDHFVKQLDKLQDRRKKLGQLLSEVEAAEGEEKLKPAEKVLELLKEAELTRYYKPTLRKWFESAQQSDPKNEKGVNEVFFEAQWMARAEEAGRTSLESLRQILAELDNWKKQCEFKDANRAGRLHLFAATCLAVLDRMGVPGLAGLAAKYAREGLAYNPTDKNVLEHLKQATKALTILSSGSGFVVAEGGYILTNRHVIEGEGNVMVRIGGAEDPVPGKVVAKDDGKDMALVKIDVPDGVELKPIPVSAADLALAEDVAAFGYPLGDLVSKSIQITTGVVSAPAKDSDEGMVILDLTVNPGNSGGPLCNTRGEVVGLVTAKSASSEFSHVESYGMARPGKDMQEFLKKHLPGYAPAGRQTERPEQKWSEIAKAISPSVLMILKTR